MTNHIPPTIPLSSIDLGERGRTEYKGIEALAQSIQDNGLIEPIVLVAQYSSGSSLDYGGGMELVGFKLNAGGRRYHALKFLGVETLHHATTSDPSRPGFILAGESSPLKNLLVEIAENLDRHDLPWQDEVRLMVRAYHLAQVEANSRGENILIRHFGSTLGVSYAHLQSALLIAEDLKVNPDRYKECTSIRVAYAKLLSENRKFAEAELASRLLPQKGGDGTEASNTIDSRTATVTGPGGIIVEQPSRPTAEFGRYFHRMDGIKWMMSQEPNSIDHVVTDPDYGVAIDLLESNSDTQATGVAQQSIGQTLNELEVFIDEAFRITRAHGFLVFFYDLDHHEKLQALATQVGWAVQRWPLIWHKTDHFSNAAPSYNFTKNMEYAMVCRKPGAVLTSVQTSSIFSCPSGNATKLFGHPFAKPQALWHWIYKAVATKGQTVLDPFMGSGSGPCSAITFGLQPIGIELQEQHFNSAVLNLKRTYTQVLGPCDFI